MPNKIIKILTSYNKPLKTCAIGNEAVARGAIEAGIKGVFSYPGTPSTEISEMFNYVNIFQIVICDDPGCHSSSNEQDSRYWAKMASVPLFNPATPEDAYSMTTE